MSQLTAPAAYFNLTDDDPAPTVVQTFTPGRGWEETAGPGRQHERPRISRTLAGAYSARGITSVLLHDSRSGRAADFRIAELTRLDRRPLLAGNLI